MLPEIILFKKGKEMNKKIITLQKISETGILFKSITAFISVLIISCTGSQAMNPSKFCI